MGFFLFYFLEELIGLLLALVRLWPSVMMIGHVPVYLAAYNASLSTCDQTLLEVIQSASSGVALL